MANEFTGSSQRTWSTTAVKHEKFLTRVHEEFPTSSSDYSLNLAKFSEEFPTRSSTRISTRSSKREVHTSSTIAGLKMINALNLEHDGRDEAKALWEATKSVKSTKPVKATKAFEDVEGR
jgi:hypothetical protein